MVYILLGLNSSRAVSRKNSFSKPNRNSSVPNVSAIKNNTKNIETPRSLHIVNPPVDLYVNNKLSPDQAPMDNEFVPSSIDRPVGVDFDDFLPVSNRTKLF